MPSAPPEPALAELTQQLEAVIAILGYDGTRGFVRQWSHFRSTTNRHVVRQAFDAIRVHSVFRFSARRPKALKVAPILSLAVSPDEAAAAPAYSLLLRHRAR